MCIDTNKKYGPCYQEIQGNLSVSAFLRVTMKYYPWDNVVGLSGVVILFEPLDVSEVSVGRLTLSGSVELIRAIF